MVHVATRINDDACNGPTPPFTDKFILPFETLADFLAFFFLLPLWPPEADDAEAMAATPPRPSCWIAAGFSTATGNYGCLTSILTKDFNEQAFALLFIVTLSSLITALTLDDMQPDIRGVKVFRPARIDTGPFRRGVEQGERGDCGALADHALCHDGHRAPFIEQPLVAVMPKQGSIEPVSFLMFLRKDIILYGTIHFRYLDI